MPTSHRTLDNTFRALAAPARRAVLERLSRGPAAVTELAEPFDMALPSFMQHLRILEQGGLVRSRKVGRVRTYEIALPPIDSASDWLRARRDTWERQLDQFDRDLTQLPRKGSDR